MKKIIRSRVFWFFIGLIFLPTLGKIFNMVGNPSAISLIPIESEYTESKTFWLTPAEYDYILKSKVSDKEKFHKFAQDMKMDHLKVSEDRYEYRSESGQFTKTITYENGYIV